MIPPAKHHQSVLYGGIISAVLLEVIARIAFLHDRWA